MSNTKASLTQQNTQTYPSNTSGSITALSVKSFNNNFINAVATLGDTNVFTEPQTFGNTVQVNSDVTANNFIGPLIGTASWAIQALTASFAVNTNINTGSLLITASSALNTITFTKGDNTTFDVTVNTGSATTVNTGSLLVTASVSNDIITFTKGNNTTFDITVNNVKNSSTSSVISVGGDNTNTDRKIVFVGTTVASINEQLLIAANAPDLTYNPTTNVINATASFANNATTASHALNVPSTGSLLTTASVSLNTITFTKGDASTFAITVDTGSGGGSGFATTGSNIFSGSQTFNTASLFLNASGSGPLFTNFTQSVVGAGVTGGAYGNIFLIPTSINSGSVIISGSRNIGTLNPITNAQSLTSRGGGNLNGNIGNFNSSYTTASSPIVLINNFVGGAVNNAIPNTSSVTTLNSNFVGGTVITTGSATSAVNIILNNIDAAIITNNFTGSGASQAVSVSSNIIKGGTTQPNFAQIKFASTSSNTNSRTFVNNIMFGPANIASLEASGAVGATSHLLNTAIIGSNLVVSGTMASNSTSASMFVGQFNETGSLADPSQIKFAVGAGTTNAARKTPFFVSQSGEVVIAAPGGGTNTRGNSVFGANFVKIAQNTVNSNTTVAAFNASLATNGGSTNGLSTALIAGEVAAITAGRSSATIGSSYVIINTNSSGGDTNNVMVGAFDSQISGSTSFFTGIYSSTGSFINEGRHSAIIAANNARLNNTTGSVALGRDTAYTGSANYTLFTQNVDISGSLTVNGNKQYNYGSFYNTSSITLTANTSQSLAFTTIDEASGFTLSGSNNEQIKATNAGTYNLQFSAQLDQGANSANYYIWLKKNGSNVANTAGKDTIAANHSDITSWNYVVSLAANDTLELVIQSDANNSSVAYIAASGNIPAAPSVIATITQVK